ncbi:hypothetical protein LTR17_026677 [Elasticomyces elasticus]|nr:hypothetical protein LTR17_026677 [Elasticomyces elasticus]
MASTGAPHSFFADEMHHHRDEQTVYEEVLRQPLAYQAPALPNFAYRPVLPTEGAAPQPPAPSANPRIGLKLQMPGILAAVVKTEDFSPINDDDWAQASIEYDSLSPASAMSMADSPVTPEFSGSPESYTERFFSDGHHANNPPALAFAESIGFDAKPFVPPMHPYSAPAGFEYGRYDGRPSWPAPVQTAPPDVYLGHPVAMEDQRAFSPPPAYLLAARALGANSTAPAQTPLGSESFRDSDLSISDSDETSSQRSASSADNYVVYSGAANEVARAREHDEILVQRRADGWTYRKIRDTYRFTAAEATLRGRYRMLTKGKHERVRKPTWTRNDILLLRRAVAHYEAKTRGKLPWKKIGDWVADNGGSYRFGGSTCARKWDQLGEPRV